MCFRTLKLPGSIAEMRSSSDVARKLLYGLKPTRNEQEFEHFRLMADLRNYYLAFKELESVYNSDQFVISNSEQLATELERLLDESKTLDQRFADLNKGFLYDSEIRDQNRIRNLGLNVLYNRLSKTRQ